MERIEAHIVTLSADASFDIPAEVMDRHQWRPGQSVIAIDADLGLLLTSPDDALALLRRNLVGRDLVAELIDDRHREAEAESMAPGAPTIAP